MLKRWIIKKNICSKIVENKWVTNNVLQSQWNVKLSEKVHCILNKTQMSSGITITYHAFLFFFIVHWLQYNNSS
jgi:hypothetical protein